MKLTEEQIKKMKDAREKANIKIEMFRLGVIAVLNENKDPFLFESDNEIFKWINKISIEFSHLEIEKLKIFNISIKELNETETFYNFGKYFAILERTAFFKGKKTEILSVIREYERNMIRALEK